MALGGTLVVHRRVGHRVAVRSTRATSLTATRPASAKARPSFSMASGGIDRSLSPCRKTNSARAAAGRDEGCPPRRWPGRHRGSHRPRRPPDRDRPSAARAWRPCSTRSLPQDRTRHRAGREAQRGSGGCPAPRGRGQATDAGHRLREERLTLPRLPQVGRGREVLAAAVAVEHVRREYDVSPVGDPLAHVRDAGSQPDRVHEEQHAGVLTLGRRAGDVRLRHIPSAMWISMTTSTGSG